MGGDQAQVAGAVRRGGGDRRQDAGRAGLRQRALPSLPADAPGRGRRPRRGAVRNGRATRRVREPVRGTLRGVRGSRQEDAGSLTANSSAISVHGSSIRTLYCKA